MKDYICIDGKKVELSEETAKNLKKEFVKEEYIEAPDFVDNKRIYFNNFKQKLYFAEGTYSFEVTSLGYATRTGYKLIPIKREDLKKGDIAYRTETPIKEDKCSHKDKEEYCVILNDEMNVSVKYNQETSVNDDIYTYWYKVVKA